MIVLELGAVLVVAVLIGWAGTHYSTPKDQR